MTKEKIDTLILSDIHFGSELCNAELLFEVMSKFKFRRLILNGDIFDHLNLEFEEKTRHLRDGEPPRVKKHRLKKSHLKALSFISGLSKPENDCEVVWIEGNHDEGISYIFSSLIGATVYNEYMWEYAGKINRDGGFAEFLLTSARSVVKLDPSLHPTQIAALADAGLTAIHAVKKAIPVLGAGTKAVVIGAGGLGHIGIQCLKAYTPTEIIVVDPSEKALALAAARGHHTVKVDGTQRDKVKELTDGMGAEAIIDFVGEKGAIEDGIDFVQDGGFYYVIGYGENINIPTIDVISREISFIGNLVGTYVDLAGPDDPDGAGPGHAAHEHVPAGCDQRRDGGPRPRAAPGPRDFGSRARRAAWASVCTSTMRRGGAAGRRRRACQHGQGDAWPEGSKRGAERLAGPPTITNDGVSIAREISSPTSTATWAPSSYARSRTRPRTSPATARRQPPARAGDRA